MGFKYYLGIDPDVDKCGVALWNKEEQRFNFVKSIQFWDIIEFLNTGEIKGLDKTIWDGYPIQVIIEGGWLVEKSNYHQKIKRADSREKIAKNVGMNHTVGILLQKFCEKEGIPCEIIKPGGLKIAAQAFRMLTKWEGATNQDNRDAALLVFKK